MFRNTNKQREKPMRKLLGVGLFLGLAGCAIPPGGELGPANNLQAGIEVAGPDTFLGQLPVAFVVLKPDPGGRTINTRRNQSFCESFITLPTPSALQGSNAVALNIVRTRWPITSSNATLSNSVDCGFLLSNYDTDRMNAAVSNITLTKGNFNGQGPFFVIVSGKDVNAIDGSDTSDFKTFVQSWNNALNQTQQRTAANTPSSGTAGMWERFTSLIVSIVGSIFPVAQTITGFVRGAIC
jgi:hypothetical protein